MSTVKDVRKEMKRTKLQVEDSCIGRRPKVKRSGTLVDF